MHNFARSYLLQCICMTWKLPFAPSEKQENFPKNCHKVRPTFGIFDSELPWYYLYLNQCLLITQEKLGWVVPQSRLNRSTSSVSCRGIMPWVRVSQFLCVYNQVLSLTIPSKMNQVLFLSLTILSKVLNFYFWLICHGLSVCIWPWDMTPSKLFVKIMKFLLHVFLSRKINNDCETLWKFTIW